MSRNAKGGLVALVLAAAVGVTPLAIAGQQGQGVTVTRVAQGWLGIRFDLQVGPARQAGEPELVMTIRQVQDDSPAARAGIRAGDTVLRIDGQPVTTGSLDALLGDLDPGERVRLTLRRDARSLETSVVAGRRPTGVVSVAPTVSVRIDSITSAIVARMDSARVSFERGTTVIRNRGENRVVYARPDTIHGHAVWVRPDSIGGHYVLEGPRGRLVMPHVAQLSDPTRTVPLEVFLFQSQEADSLRREMAQLQRELRTVSEAERRRIQELAEEMARTRRREIDQSDARLRALREQEARLEVELARARQEMERARDAVRQERAERVREIQEQSARLAEESRRVAEVHADFRPLSIYAAGRNMLAGARLTDLNPALAEYFEVEGGVLVTEVLAETPAAEAPLLGGDVIVRVGDTRVDDLDDLRAALVRSPAEASLTVVRKGRRVAVTIPRD